MSKKITRKNANKIMWVEYWIRKADQSKEQYDLSTEKYDKNRWICKIELPLIGKSIQSISKKEVDAMINASKKASKLIDKYMEEHHELKITNEFKCQSWEILSNENGRLVSIGKRKSMRRKEGAQIVPTYSK